MVGKSQTRTKRRCLNQERESSPPKWSQLPTELLELILEKFHTVMDLMTFKAVCSPWRSTGKAYTSAPSYNPPQNPCLMFQANLGNTKQEYTCLFDPIGKTVYKLENVFKYSPAEESKCLGSSYGWLTFQHPINLDLYLYNPLSRARIQLPHLPLDNFGPYCYGARKVIVSADPSSNSNFDVAVLTGGKILFCKKGEKSWCMLRDSASSNKDIMFHKEHLYAVTSTGWSLSVWDCKQSPPVFSSMSFEWLLPGFVLNKLSYYLAVSKTGEILRVLKSLKSYSTDDNGRQNYYRFDVEKLNMTRINWEKVESLGEETLIVSSDQVTSLCYRSVSGFEENSVYDFGLFKRGRRRVGDDAGYAIGHHKLEEDGEFCRREYLMTSFFDCPDLRPLSYCTHRRLFWFIPTV